MRGPSTHNSSHPDPRPVRRALSPKSTHPTPFGTYQEALGSFSAIGHRREPLSGPSCRTQPQRNQVPQGSVFHPLLAAICLPFSSRDSAHHKPSSEERPYFTIKRG